ncbi:hypothetical protein [Haloechinothrix halophila]|uniref:hypothetical protein n=1 Tax=Haloechinothrix halophila TaxID=1069073 RepID=UPI000426677F|nr:hypothetical protein [Haloechinothrix halophila]
MDPLDRADALLSRAQARGTFVVTPNSAVSPMDASSTVQIPRTMVTSAEDDIDPDATTVLSDEQIRENDERRHPRAERDRARQPPHARGAGHRYGTLEEQAQREADEVETEEITGLIPTTTQRRKSNLSRRLDG